MAEPYVDLELLVDALLTILDLIEIQNNSPEIDRLCKMRFLLAEELGLTVEWTGLLASNARH